MSTIAPDLEAEMDARIARALAAEKLEAERDADARALTAAREQAAHDEHTAAVVAFEAARAAEIVALEPAAAEFDAALAVLTTMRGAVETRLNGSRSWLLAHLSRDYDIQLSRCQVPATGADTLLDTLRRKAAYRDVVRRYSGYFHAVASLRAADFERYRAAAATIGPAHAHPAFIGSAVGDGIVVGDTLNRLVNSTAGAKAALDVGGKWPVAE